jgi:hypothetical protein
MTKASPEPDFNLLCFNAIFCSMRQMVPTLNSTLQPWDKGVHVLFVYYGGSALL